MSLDLQEYLKALRSGDFTRTSECFEYVVSKLPKKTQIMQIDGKETRVDKGAAVDEILPALAFELYCTDLVIEDIPLVNYLVNAVLYNPYLNGEENTAYLASVCNAIIIALSMKSEQSPKTISKFQHIDFYHNKKDMQKFLSAQDKCRKSKEREISDKILDELDEDQMKLREHDQLIGQTCLNIKNKVNVRVNELIEISNEQEKQQEINQQNSEHAMILLNKYGQHLEEYKSKHLELRESSSSKEDFRMAANKVSILFNKFSSIPIGGFTVDQLQEIHEVVEACKKLENALYPTMQDNPEKKSLGIDVGSKYEVQDNPQLPPGKEIVIGPELQSSVQDDQQKESLKVESNLEGKESSVQDASTSVKVSSYAGSLFMTKPSQANAAKKNDLEERLQQSYESLKKYAKHLDKEERTLGRNAEIEGARKLVIQLSENYNSIPTSGFSEQEIERINSAITTCISIEKSIVEKSLLTLIKDYANHLKDKLERVKQINPDPNNEYFKKLQKRHNAICSLAGELGENPPPGGLNTVQILNIKAALAECKSNVPTYRERFDVKRLTDILSLLSDILSLGIKPLYRTVTSSEKKYKEELTQTIKKL